MIALEVTNHRPVATTLPGGGGTGARVRRARLCQPACIPRSRTSSLAPLFAQAGIALLLLQLVAGCDHKADPKTRGFSPADTASILLGDPDQEHGSGLEHIYWEQDGRTTPATFEGVPCRHLSLPGRASGYLYFRIDSAFKKHDLRNALVEIEYFDGSPGTMGLHFDGSLSVNKPDPAYADSSQTVRMSGTGGWQTGVFRVANATFSNAQNSRADFRLRVTPPELHVRRVALTRESAVFGEAPPRSRDFSASNSVGTVLGALGRERSGGVWHVENADDGPTASAFVGDAPCRHMKRGTNDAGYLYFALAPTFKKGDIRNVEIAVEYFDDKPRLLGLHFDASGTRKTGNPAYANSGRAVRPAGSQTWQTATFYARDATFANSQNAGSDFRLTVSPPELFVRKVTVTRVAQNQLR